MIVSLGVNEFRGNISPSIFVSDIRPHVFTQSKYFAGRDVFEAFLRNEELPKNYYPSMMPSREDVIKVYKGINETGTNFDTLFIRLSDLRLNYCRFAVAVEALRQLGLIRVASSDMNVSRVKVTERADLASAPVLVRLRELCGNAAEHKK